MKQSVLLASVTFLFLPGLLFPGRAFGFSGYNREGVELFRAGRLEEAVEKFEDALREDPASAEARRNLGQTLAALGQRKLQEGDLGSAAEYLEEAVGRQPEEAAFHLLLAFALFRRGDLYGARRAVDEALYLEEEDPQARELLGDIYYQEGYLTRAIPEWEVALEKHEGARASQLKKKISRAGKESIAESGFGRDISLHFTLQHDGPVSRETTRVVLDNLEKAYDQIGGELGVYPPGDIPVILYSKILFSDITESPLWVAGTFDGKIRVPTGGLENPREASRLRPVLAHELAHAFIRAIAPGGLPLWFEEGLAKHFEGLTAEGAEQALQRLGRPPPATLQDLDVGLRGHGALVEASYLASFLAVRGLIEREGFWTVRRILEAAGRGRPFDDAFRDETGMEVLEFQERWRSSLP